MKGYVKPTIQELIAEVNALAARIQWRKGKRLKEKQKALLANESIVIVHAGCSERESENPRKGVRLVMGLL